MLLSSREEYAREANGEDTSWPQGTSTVTIALYPLREERVCLGG